jgi:cytidyltransferase-like protein
MKHILISGVFDLFHYGHMILLKKCQEEYKDSILIVGIHSDEECEQFKRKPILSYEERKKSIEVFGLPTLLCPLLETREFYEKNNIDVTVHAHSEKDHEFYVKNCYKDAAEMGILRRFEYTSVISTSKIIERIKKK